MASSGDGDHEDNEPGKASRLEERLRKLDEQLGEAAEGARRQEPPAEDAKGRGVALGKAFRLSTELVAGVFGGGVIGWLLDSFLGTRPVFLVVFLMLGAAAGLLNAVRAAREMGKDNE